MAWRKINELLKGQATVGDEVTIKGWVRTRRDSKAGMSFIAVGDGTSFDTVQVVASVELSNYHSEILRLTTGCAVEATGTLVESQGKGQAVEIQASHITVVGWVDDPDTYPVPQKRHTFEYLREVAHLRVRTNTFGAVARVRHTLSMAIHRFFDERGFFWVHTPIITGSDAEGAGQMFRVSTLDLTRPMGRIQGAGESPEAAAYRKEVEEKGLNTPPWSYGQVDFSQDFFGKETHLTVSGQLNVETYACALSRVYTFGPTFRAENSNTSRHLAEFWMVEPEIAFADLSADADLAEDMLRYLADALLTERADDMAFFQERIDKAVYDRLKHIIEKPFRRLTYTDAIEVLEKSGKSFEFPIKWGTDMQSEHERYLTEEHFKQPLVVTNYPKQIKAFYMRLDDEAPGGSAPAGSQTVAAMDVLVPGVGEIIGGSQREERLDVLDARMDEMGLNKDDYWWYRDLRRYGTVPHAGFGLGLERFMMFATGMTNIRDIIPFPRAPRQCEF